MGEYANYKLYFLGEMGLIKSRLNNFIERIICYFEDCTKNNILSINCKFALTCNE